MPEVIWLPQALRDVDRLYRFRQCRTGFAIPSAVFRALLLPVARHKTSATGLQTHMRQLKPQK